MIAFIDDHRGVHGVEPICKVLPMAPSTYWADVAKRADPARLSARAKRDAALKIEVRRVFEENFGVYGVRKVWRQLKRDGFDVARCTVERLMQSMGLQGVIRGKRDCQYFCVRPVIRHEFTNRSLNMTANWVFASAHSRGGRFHSAAAWFKTKYSSFVAASSEGKCPLVLTARRSFELSASMAFVV